MYGICLTEQIRSVGQTVIHARVTPRGEINHEISARQSLKFLHVQTIHISTANNSRFWVFVQNKVHKGDSLSLYPGSYAWEDYTGHKLA